MAALKVTDGIAALKVTELGDYLREQRHSAQLSLRQLAAVAGVSNPYLSQVERGLRKPSAEVLQQIAKGLRISAEALYVRAGILDEREDRVEVEAAVLADPHLTERQRQVLLDIYATFRAQPADTAPQGRSAAQDGATAARATKSSARGRPSKRSTARAAATTVAKAPPSPAEPTPKRRRAARTLAAGPGAGSRAARPTAPDAEPDSGSAGPTRTHGGN